MNAGGLGTLERNERGARDMDTIYPHNVNNREGWRRCRCGATDDRDHATGCPFAPIGCQWRTAAGGRCGLLAAHPGQHNERRSS